MATMIKNPYHCTFIHIPKTGGNSITTWMQQNFKSVVTKRQQHATKKEAEQRFGDLGWTFCVVRNPWDYMVSWYEFKKMLASSRIELLEKQPELQNNRKQKFNLEANRKSLTRLEQGFDWWVRQTGRDNQYHWAKNVDYIMKLENLNNDFSIVQEKLGCDIPLGHLNKTRTRHKKYQEYYTPELVDVVSKKYKADIEKFGYEF